MLVCLFLGWFLLLEPLENIFMQRNQNFSKLYTNAICAVNWLLTSQSLFLFYYHLFLYQRFFWCSSTPDHFTSQNTLSMFADTSSLHIICHYTTFLNLLCSNTSSLPISSHILLKFSLQRLTTQIPYSLWKNPSQQETLSSKCEQWRCIKHIFFNCDSRLHRGLEVAEDKGSKTISS